MMENERAGVLGTLALWATAVILFIGFAARMLWRGGRATHTAGIGVAGDLTLASALPLPANAFFQPGIKLRLVARDASALGMDEMARDVRSLSLQIENPSSDTPVCLLMNTGEVQSVHSGLDALYRGMMAPLGRWGRRIYAGPGSLGHRTELAGLRIAPSSFSDLSIPKHSASPSA